MLLDPAYGPLPFAAERNPRVPASPLVQRKMNRYRTKSYTDDEGRGRGAPFLAGVPPRRAQLRHVGRVKLSRDALMKGADEIERRPLLVDEFLP